MDCFQFAKMIKHSGIRDDIYIDTQAVDLAFMQVRGPNERRITFAQFMTTLQLLADRLGGTDRLCIFASKIVQSHLGNTKEMKRDAIVAPN